SASQITNTTNVATPQASTTIRQTQVEHVGQMLRAVSNPQLAIGAVARDKASRLKQELMEKKQKGDKLAESILQAQDELAKETQVDKKQEIENKLINDLLEAEKKGDTLAKELLPESTSQPVTPRESLPMVNKVQQV